MPEYHSFKKHSSGFSGEIHLGNYTSQRMRLLREKRRGDKPELTEEEELQKLRDEFGKRIALSEQQQDAATSVEHHQRLEKKQSKSQYTPILLEEAPVPSPEQSITASVAVAKQAYQQQDYANAYELFTQIVNKQPDNYEALFHLGVSATETGNHNVAIETTKKLIDSGHFTAQAFYFQGRSLEELGRKPEAAIAYQKAAFEIPEAHQAFMRLESEKLLGGFSNANSQTGHLPHRPASQDWQRQSVAWKPFSRDRVSSKIASAEDRGVTKQKNQGRQSPPTKSASTSPKSSKPSKPSRSVREDTTFNQSGRPSNYPRKDTTSEQPRKQNKPSSLRRKDTTFNQSGNSSSSFNFRGKDIAPTLLVKQGKSSARKTATKAKGQLDVSQLVPVEKLAQAVSRSAKALPEELAEELRALFTPATLATMVGVFAAYIAAHATGIGQAMDIGMLIAGGIFFGLDAFAIFKDLAGFAGAVNATTEEELDRAGEHLASAIAKIGVDAVMTLLTKKVADEVGKTVDHVNQVDEVHAHSEGADNINAGDLDNAEGVNAGQVNDVDNVRSGSNTEIEGRQSTEASSSSAIIPASPSGMSDNLVNIRSTLNDPRAVEAFDNMFGKMRGNSEAMERAVEGMRRGGSDIEERMLQDWEKANRTAFGAAVGQIPDAITRGQRLKDEVQAFKDANPNVKGVDEWFERLDGDLNRLDELQKGKRETTSDRIQGSLNNFNGVEAELRYAQSQSSVVGVGQKMPLDGKPDKVDVDIVADNGNTWVDNKNVKPFGLESSTWKGDGGNKQGLKQQAEKLIKSAQQNPNNGVPPKVVIEFPQGVSRSVAQELQKIGVEVRGNIVDR